MYPIYFVRWLRTLAVSAVGVVVCTTYCYAQADFDAGSPAAGEFGFESEGGSGLGNGGLDLEPLQESNTELDASDFGGLLLHGANTADFVFSVYGFITFLVFFVLGFVAGSMLTASVVRSERK